MSAASRRIVRLTETASTNADARRLALSGEPLPLWVSAERQTAGRGRAGRAWLSEPGNLQASVAVATEAPVRRAGELSLVAGVAVIDAIRLKSPLAERAPVRLKWPNDVLIGTAKAGGILVETMMARGEPGFLAVIGFGLNLKTRPEALGHGATALSDHGIPVSADELLDALADRCEHWLAIWDEGRGFETIRTEWMKRAGPLGEGITINLETGPRTATYRGLAPSGALLIETDAGEETVSYGDVMLVAQIDESKGE